MRVKIFKYIGIILIVIVLIIFLINLYVVISTKKQIVENSEYSKLNEIDCILVLEAGVWEDRPSPILEDRLNKAIQLYEKGVSSKIIMRGDHGRKDYDEVNIMKKYLINSSYYI